MNTDQHGFARSAEHRLGALERLWAGPGRRPALHCRRRNLSMSIRVHPWFNAVNA